MQHRAREASYAAAHPGADDLVISVSGTPAGRVLVCRSERVYHVVDIAILPEYRNRGLGSVVIRSLIEEARLRDRPLRLIVATDNVPALRLYRALGFETTSEDGMNIEMEIPAPKSLSGRARRSSSTR